MHASVAKIISGAKPRAITKVLHGEIMPIQEWLWGVDDRMFTDDNGFGYLSDGKYYYKRPFYPSFVLNEKFGVRQLSVSDFLPFTHMIWFIK